MACQPLLFDIWFPRYESLKILDLAFRKGETANTWGARVGGASHIAKMAILGMSGSNFYSAQNTVSRS